MDFEFGFKTLWPIATAAFWFWVNGISGRLKTENKKEIENVLTQDRKNASGGCIDGFGHHGLQLYNRALGYGN